MRLQRQRSADMTSVEEQQQDEETATLSTTTRHTDHSTHTTQDHLKPELVRRATVAEGAGISWRRSLQHPHDTAGQTQDDQQLDAPPLLSGQHDLQEKLYSSRGISRRLTSTSPSASGECNLPTLATTASDDVISPRGILASADLASEAVMSLHSQPALLQPKKITRGDKDGWLNYLSGWLLYRPSAATLAEKNILKSNEVPPGTAGTKLNNYRRECTHTEY